MNPTPPLPAGSDSTTQPQFERGQHLGHRPAFCAQDQSNAEVHHPYASLDRRLGSFFPLATNLGQKSSPNWALFPQNLVPPIPVEPNRRCAHQHARPHLSLGQRCSQVARSQHTTVSNRVLFFVGPASDYALPGQVDDRVEPRNRRRRQRSQRVPGNLLRTLRRPAHEPHNLRPLSLERS